MAEIPELTEEQLARAIPARVRKRLMQGQLESGEDIATLRRFVGLTQVQFALAMGISVHTLRNWEQGRRQPEGPAMALLRIAARHPRIIRENIESVSPQPEANAASHRLQSFLGVVDSGGQQLSTETGKRLRQILKERQRARRSD